MRSTLSIVLNRELGIPNAFREGSTMIRLRSALTLSSGE